MVRFYMLILGIMGLTWGTVSAHGTDSLPLPPVMDVITGDFPAPSAAYYEWAMENYRPAGEGENQPFVSPLAAIEYHRALAANGETKAAVQGLQNYYLGHLDFETTDLSPEPRPGHYSTVWHLARLQYSTRAYSDAAASLASLQNFETFRDSLLTRDQYLTLFFQYLEQNDARTDLTAPLFPDENRNFGAFLRDSLGWAIDFTGQEPEVARALQGILMMIRHAETAPPQTAWEGMGDLLLCLPDVPEAKYMASFAYERAALYASDTLIRDQWRDKALFCLESKAEKKQTYNPRRFYQLEKIINEQFTESAARAQAFKDQEAALLADGNPPVETYSPTDLPWIYTPSGNIIDFWPEREAYEPLRVVNAELLNEGSKVGADPNADPRNKKLDPKMVKRNVSYNLYALLIFTILFSVMGVIIWRFRKASKEKRGE